MEYPTAVVDRDDMVAFGKVGERGEPIQRPGGGESVKEHQGRRSLGAFVLDDPDATSAFQVQEELVTAGASPRSRVTLFCFACQCSEACRRCRSCASRWRGSQIRT